MRFMIIVKATRDSEAGVMPDEALLAAMQKYHEELVKSGVLVDASGLKPSSQGWRIRYSGDKRTSSTAHSPRPRKSSPATRSSMWHRGKKRSS